MSVGKNEDKDALFGPELTTTMRAVDQVLLALWGINCHKDSETWNHHQHMKKNSLIKQYKKSL